VVSESSRDIQGSRASRGSIAGQTLAFRVDRGAVVEE